MLRFASFSQFDGAQLWFVLFIVIAILLKIKWYVLLFGTRQSIRSFDKFCSFRNDICIFLIFNPKKQTEQRFYAALVRKASDWSWRCQRGLGNIYISTGFLSALSFWKLQPKVYWIFNCDSCIWPLCNFTDRISQTR